MDRYPALKDNFCSYHNRNSLNASLKRSHAIPDGFGYGLFCSSIFRCLISGSFGHTWFFRSYQTLLAGLGSFSHTRLDRVSGSPIGSGMTMEFGFGFPIVVGNDNEVWVWIPIGVGNDDYVVGGNDDSLGRNDDCVE